MVPLMIAGWVLCAWLAQAILREAWRFDFDYKTDDRNVFWFMGLIGGPLSVVVAGAIFLMEWRDYVRTEPQVLKPKRKVS